MKRTGLAVFGYTALTFALLMFFSSSAQAVIIYLVEDGDFESLDNREFWDVVDPVEFEKLPDGDSRIANMGEGGTGQDSRLSQILKKSSLLPTGVSMVSISFDYLFTGLPLGSPPDFEEESPDVFNATFGYNIDLTAPTDDTILGNLVSIKSNESEFDDRLTFKGDFQVDSALGIPFIAFDLTESVSDFDFGTRVEIDNVVVLAEVPDPVLKPVPEPATILMLGAGIAGLAGFKRKTASKRKTL